MPLLRQQRLTMELRIEWQHTHILNTVITPSVHVPRINKMWVFPKKGHTCYANLLGTVIPILPSVGLAIVLTLNKYWKTIAFYLMQPVLLHKLIG